MKIQTYTFKNADDTLDTSYNFPATKRACAKELCTIRGLCTIVDDLNGQLVNYIKEFDVFEKFSYKLYKQLQKDL